MFTFLVLAQVLAQVLVHQPTIMHTLRYYIFALLSSVAHANLRDTVQNSLARRQNTCVGTNKQCGTGCISLTYTCCPDGSGGCPASEVCQLGSNGKYGCCPVGEDCIGKGGVRTTGTAGTITLPSTTTYVPTKTTGLDTGASTCAATAKACGTGCINSLWTCCPGGLGACSASDECQQDRNGNWGCCAIGKNCVGTVSGSSRPSTSTRLSATTSTRIASATGACDASTQKSCGDGCCPSTSKCYLSTNGNYRCCPLAETCIDDVSYVATHRTTSSTTTTISSSTVRSGGTYTTSAGSHLSSVSGASTHVLHRSVLDLSAVAVVATLALAVWL